jgi:hypothetical protein
VKRTYLLVVIAMALGGCGGHEATSSLARPQTRPAPLLLNFKRTVGFDPLSSELTIRSDGHATAVITLGGVDGEKKHVFTLPRTQLAQVKRMLARTRLRSTSCCNVNLYIYWLIARGQSVRLQQGRLPVRLKPLIAELNAIADAHMSY